MEAWAPCAKAGRGGECRSPFSSGREGGSPVSPLGWGQMLPGGWEQTVEGFGPALPEGPMEAQKLPGLDTSSLQHGARGSRAPTLSSPLPKQPGLLGRRLAGSCLCLLPRLLPPSCRDLPGLGTARTRIRSGCWLGSCQEHAGAEPEGANAWVCSHQPQAGVACSRGTMAGAPSEAWVVKALQSGPAQSGPPAS